jgi:hypothetical protein
MKRTPIVFLLLLAIALGVSAGPHPCHAAEGQPAPVEAAVAEHASCHGTPAPAKAPVQEKKDHDCCDPAKGGHVLCDNACQGAAVVGVAPTVPAALSFQEVAADVLDRPASLFVLSIDHVPLS